MFNKTLLKFSSNTQDHFTIDDALKGISIIGGTGSGKTSGSGKALAREYLKQGWGGLVLCAKTDEADLWKSYCKETGREKDLIVFSNNAVHDEGEHSGQTMVFNPIDYEMKREGDGAGQTFNITNIFMNIYKMGNRISGGGEAREERYWDTALKRCLNRIIELLKLSGEDLSYKNMVKVLTTSVGLDKNEYEVELEYIREHEDNSRLEWSENYCLKCIINALANSVSDIDSPNYKENYDAFMLVHNYFLIERPKVDEKTNAIVSESFMGLAEPFLSGMLSKHFSGATNILPEWTYQQNKIIVLDFPVKEYLDSGIIAQSIFKLLFQQAVERRDVKKYPDPIFLWVDEAQYFINPYDQIFLTTARSSRTSTVFLSQNISNYLAVMGEGRESEAKVNSLMGNLATKIFHANSDAKTNAYASELIGEKIQTLEGMNKQAGFLKFDFSSTQTFSPNKMPQVFPYKFTLLKSGGVNNDFIVQAYIFITGKRWSSETNYIEANFKQNF